MVAHTDRLHHISAFLLFAAIIVFLLLLVVVPAKSQLQPPNQAVEIIQEPAQEPSIGMVLLLVFQLVLLMVMMLSYLAISAKITSQANTIRHHHHWPHLHFHA